ncbi:neurotrypsin-like [Dreissena polymorpha]|uniref:neurotrypsin-like n=1 Tax=Dreissena polymorpha TaxID=45954 RepID=UPI0022650F70|nr:neurotrypsin-like [Dreissena polymorpha]
MDSSLYNRYSCKCNQTSGKLQCLGIEVECKPIGCKIPANVQQGMTLFDPLDEQQKISAANRYEIQHGQSLTFICEPSAMFYFEPNRRMFECDKGSWVAKQRPDEVICEEHYCKFGGHCIRDHECICPEQTRGEQCQIPLCSPECQNGGTCVSPDRCQCTEGFGGARCACRLEEFLCEDGQCVDSSSVCDGTCHCTAGCADERLDGENNCTSWRIRLVNGSHYFGRVEITINGLTGSVCDHYFDNNDATVVCQEVGYRYGHAVLRGKYGYGSGPIWLDDVNCNGDENLLSSCRHGGLGKSNCDHTNDAGVICMNNIPTVTGPSVSAELLDGPNKHSGRVELIIGNRRGSVCDDSWDDKDASVICRMLGYGEGKVLSKASFGQGNSSILLDDVECDGNETSVMSCRHSGVGIHNCNHTKDAGVICSPKNTFSLEELTCRERQCLPYTSYVCGGFRCNCTGCERAGLLEDIGTSGSIRLVNGSHFFGRVEITINGLTGSVCDHSIDNNRATVVCRALGFRFGHAIQRSHYGYGGGPIWFATACTGDEFLLSRCRVPLKSDCDHNNVAGVICMNTLPKVPNIVAEGRTAIVELVDGPNKHSGRVEIFVGNRRGTVCDDSWDDTDASVICRMLGYYGGGHAQIKAHFGQGSSDILLDDVQCDGSETSVMSCRHSGVGIHNCDHTEDAGVICSPKNINEFTELRVELVNGPDNRSGRVEIVIGINRGTVCDDEWDDNDAKVICKMLGYDGGKALGEAHFGQGSSSIFLDDVLCDGTESSITACRHSGLGIHDCKHDEDASVRCSPKIECGRRPLKHYSRKRRNSYERIVGLPERLEATRGFYPWQVGVRIETSNICGGTILNDRWILSAAHCFHNKTTSTIRVYTGDHDLMKSDPFEQQFELEQLIEHPNFASVRNGYDIALMKVKLKKGSGIKFNEEVQPACLPDAGMHYETGKMCHISGWGKTSLNATGYPTVLRAAEVPLVDDVDCKRQYTTFTQNMVCAGYMDGGIDTCYGDSGGPLVCSVDGLYYVMGVTSFGRKCGLKDYPGVYAKVAPFQSWIETTIASYP